MVCTLYNNSQTFLTCHYCGHAPSDLAQATLLNKWCVPFSQVVATIKQYMHPTREKSCFPSHVVYQEWIMFIGRECQTALQCVVMVICLCRTFLYNREKFCIAPHILLVPCGYLAQQKILFKTTLKRLPQFLKSIVQ